MLLSLGITTAPDPGNVTALTLARRARPAKGDLLRPRVYASTLIDGKGPNTAQVAEVATSQEEAIAKVRKAKSDGMTGVKFYGTDRKSTRLNSSHSQISYAVFCLKKKKNNRSGDRGPR